MACRPTLLLHQPTLMLPSTYLIPSFIKHSNPNFNPSLSFCLWFTCDPQKYLRWTKNSFVFRECKFCSHEHMTWIRIRCRASVIPSYYSRPKKFKTKNIHFKLLLAFFVRPSFLYISFDKTVKNVTMFSSHMVKMLSKMPPLAENVLFQHFKFFYCSKISQISLVIIGLKWASSLGTIDNDHPPAPTCNCHPKSRINNQELWPDTVHLLIKSHSCQDQARNYQPSWLGKIADCLSISLKHENWFKPNCHFLRGWSNQKGFLLIKEGFLALWFEIFSGKLI